MDARGKFGELEKCVRVCLVEERLLFSSIKSLINLLVGKKERVDANCFACFQQW